MKTHVRLLAIGVLFISISACWEKEPVIPRTPCTSTETSYTNAINLFDGQWWSPYFNQVVANFKFEQVITSYSGQECTSTLDKGSIRLKIQNNTNKKITMDYLIQYSLNAGGWSYQGVAVINPYSTYDVGEISQKTTRVNNTAASFMIYSNSITYQ